MHLKSYTLYIPYSNFEDQEHIDLFLSKNLYNFCIDYQYETISAVSTIDYSEKNLIKFKPNFILSNKEGSYDISRDDNNIIVYFYRYNYQNK
jgi:hypothetical protein